MSIQAVPNQPLDWQLLPLAESDCPDCPPADYCSPMLFIQEDNGSGNKYYTSEEMSYQIIVPIDTACPNELSGIEEKSSENATWALNDDGSVRVDFGYDGCDSEPVAEIAFDAIPTTEGCPLIFDFCLNWDTECDQFFTYPIYIPVEISGATTPLTQKTITIASRPDPASGYCGNLVFDNITDTTISLNINATNITPLVDCDPNPEVQDCCCTSLITFYIRTGCGFKPNGASPVGEVIDTDAVFNQTYYSVDTYDAQNYVISGGFQITEIWAVPTTGQLYSWDDYRAKCMNIYLGFDSNCCSENICDASFISTCIKPITDPCGTVKVTYYQDVTSDSDSLGFGFIYPAANPSSSTFKQYMRFKANVRDAKYDGAMVSYQDSLGRKRVVYAERRKSLSLNTDLLPEFVHDALSLACRHDNFFLEDELFGVNNNFFTRSTDYSPTYVRMSRLAPVKLEVEAKTQDLKKNMCI